MIGTKGLLASVLVGSLVLVGTHFTTLLADSGATNVVVAGWTTTRGGANSFESGAAFMEARDSLTANFNNTTFASVNTLTAASLANVDILVLTSALDPMTSISPLTAAEQTALFDYVSNGGAALLLVDNDTFGTPGNNPEPVNESLIDAFGLDVTGSLLGDVDATPVGVHPATTGVGSINMFYPGTLDGLGAFASSIATEDNTGGTVLAAIDPDVITPGSGPVVISSDHNVFLDFQPGVFGRFSFADNETLFLSIMDFLCQSAGGGPDPGDVLQVDIDVRPRKSKNKICLEKKSRRVKVAILSSPTFDAATVDATTIVIAGAEPETRLRFPNDPHDWLAPLIEEPRTRLKDVNKDGRKDLVFLIEIRNFDPDELADGIAELTATTFGGQDIEGEDSVLLRCKHHKKHRHHY